MLTAWRETRYFSSTERAALAIAEEITFIADEVPGVEDLVRAADLTADQAAVIRWVAIVINALNRLAIGSHYVVKP